MVSKALQLALSWLLLIASGYSSPLRPRVDNSTCRKTKVAVLGAGVAGITAAQALSNNSITDFLILEYTDQIGGRCRPFHFGKDANNQSYTLELGANWIQGTQKPGGPENPIWRLVQKYNVHNHFTDLSSLLTYDHTGAVDYLKKLDDFNEAYSLVEQDAGYMLLQNHQDRSFRAALNLAGWKPIGDPQALAVEWYEMEYEYAQTTEVSSQEFTITNFNSTFYGFSEVNNFAFDPRGYNTFLHGEASEFLQPNDSRLLLNTIVKNITWSDDDVTIYNADGSCVQAEYAITTFSVGVLQSGDVEFIPKLPDWKQQAIQTFQMGVYTKIFFQFPPDQVFWDKSTEFFLYASPQRGYYPVWQSLDHEDFLPGSGLFFVTIVTDESYRVDRQDDETTKAEIMVTLRQMFGNDIPDPIDFHYPRWSTTPWAYGSYSNWPPGFSLEGHQNLRANVGRVYFAGEATSAEFFGYLHGAWFEGQFAGETVATRLNGKLDGEGRMGKHYDVLQGTTILQQYSPDNGWFQTSFQIPVDVQGGGG